jgi:hypothetical protein
MRTSRPAAVRSPTFQCKQEGGGFHGQGEAEWIVIRGQLRGRNDTPCGRPTPGRPIGRPGVGRPQGVFDILSNYQIVILFFNIVPLIVRFTRHDPLRVVDGSSTLSTRGVRHGGCDQVVISKTAAGSPPSMQPPLKQPLGRFTFRGGPLQCVE